MTYPVCTTRLHELVREWENEATAIMKDAPESVRYAFEVGADHLRSCALELKQALPPPIDPAELTDPQFPLLSAWITRWIEEHEDLRPEAMCAALEALLQSSNFAGCKTATERAYGNTERTDRMLAKCRCM